MNDRIEKNRHHLVTLVSLVIALAGAGTILLFVPSQRSVLWMTLLCFLFVLAGRTVMIEKGRRRRQSTAAHALETKTKEMLKAKLGIQGTDN
jgi:uncharacterized membrane protein